MTAKKLPNYVRHLLMIEGISIILHKKRYDITSRYWADSRCWYFDNYHNIYDTETMEEG